MKFILYAPDTSDKLRLLSSSYFTPQPVLTEQDAELKRGTRWERELNRTLGAFFLAMENIISREELLALTPADFALLDRRSIFNLMGIDVVTQERSTSTISLKLEQRTNFPFLTLEDVKGLKKRWLAPLEIAAVREMVLAKQLSLPKSDWKKTAKAILSRNWHQPGARAESDPPSILTLTDTEISCLRTIVSDDVRSGRVRFQDVRMVAEGRSPSFAAPLGVYDMLHAQLLTAQKLRKIDEEKICVLFRPHRYPALHGESINIPQAITKGIVSLDDCLGLRLEDLNKLSCSWPVLQTQLLSLSDTLGLSWDQIRSAVLVTQVLHDRAFIDTDLKDALLSVMERDFGLRDLGALVTNYDYPSVRSKVEATRKREPYRAGVEVPLGSGIQSQKVQPSARPTLNWKDRFLIRFGVM